MASPSSSALVSDWDRLSPGRRVAMLVSLSLLVVLLLAGLVIYMRWRSKQ